MGTKVLAKLMQARIKFHETPLVKTGENKFAGYKYFELGDFLVPALKIFAEHGLIGVVSFTADVASMSITDTESGDFLTITSPMGSAALKGCHEVQNIGAVETYQRRYLWVAALEIVEHDALDATTGKAKPEGKPGQPTDGAWDGLTPEQVTFINQVGAYIPTLGTDYKAAADYLRQQALESEEEIALWTLLDSKTRTGIKKALEGK